MYLNKKKIGAAVLAAVFTINVAAVGDSISYAAKKNDKTSPVQTTQSVNTNKPAASAQSGKTSSQAVLSNIRLGDNIKHNTQTR